MFDTFGEFDSAKEINDKAEDLFNDGRMEDIYTLAAENGIEREMAEAYISGDLPELCDITDAALGKIDVEAADLGAEEIMEDWVDYVRALAGRDTLIAANIRRRGHTLKGCIAALLIWSFEHMEPVDKEILAEAKMQLQAAKAKPKLPGFQMAYLDRTALGIPGMGRAMKMIREYYAGESKKEGTT